MSIIAWDGELIAADSLSCRGSIWTPYPKLFKLNEKTVVGITGSVSIGLEMVDWIENGCEKKSFPESQRTHEDAGFAIVAENDKVKVYETSPIPLIYKIKKGFYMAWGSGIDVALGAMYGGADAIEAVGAACYHCTDCGLEIVAYRYGSYLVPGENTFDKMTAKIGWSRISDPGSYIRS